MAGGGSGSRGNAAGGGEGFRGSAQANAAGRMGGPSGIAGDRSGGTYYNPIPAQRIAGGQKPTQLQGKQPAGAKN